MFYMMSTLIHGARSVPAITRVNFPQEREKRQQCGETESEWAMKNGKEKTETVGVRHGLPPFPPLTLFPLFVSACLGLPSLSLSCISAAQSDATVPSKSAIATSRACSVSHTDTGVYTTYEGSGGDCQGEGERGVGGCNFWNQRLSFFHLKHTTNLTSLYVNKLTSDSCCL